MRAHAPSHLKSLIPQSVTLHRQLSQVLAQDIDLLHPPAALEQRKHKLKRLVQSPNSFFMDVKCQVPPQTFSPHFTLYHIP